MSNQMQSIALNNEKIVKNVTFPDILYLEPKNFKWKSKTLLF